LEFFLFLFSARKINESASFNPKNALMMEMIFSAFENSRSLGMLIPGMHNRPLAT